MHLTSASGGPLSGVRVIEMAGFGPAPFCAMMLADMGADVVRVERANAPERGIPINTKFEVLNRGRRSIALDLKSSEGRDVLLNLVGRASILIEGYRPGVMERLGVGPDVCLGVRSSLVFGRVTGYGQDGPMAHAAGHDLNYIALTGVLHAVGQSGGAPVAPLNLVGDFGGGGMLLTAGVLAAYIEALRSGRGQIVDAAMVDGASLLMASTYGLLAAGIWKDQRGCNILDGGAPWYGVYPTRDGRYVSVAAVERRFYEPLIQALGLDAGALPAREDRARWAELREALASRIASMTWSELERAIGDADACVAPVMTMAEAPSHPQITARNTFIEIDGVVQPAPAPRFAVTPSDVRRPPPVPGEHTDEVLREWLG